MPKIVAYQNKISTCTFLDHGVVTFNELLIVGNYIRFGALVPPWLHPVFRLYQVAKNLCMDTRYPRLTRALKRRRQRLCFRLPQFTEIKNKKKHIKEILGIQIG